MQTTALYLHSQFQSYASWGGRERRLHVTAQYRCKRSNASAAEGTNQHTALFLRQRGGWGTETHILHYALCLVRPSEKKNKLIYCTIHNQLQKITYHPSVKYMQYVNITVLITDLSDQCPLSIEHVGEGRSRLVGGKGVKQDSEHHWQ